MALSEQLRRWAEAGLVTAEQADRIAAFEAADPAAAAAPAPLRPRISAVEVVAYAGTVVILVGLAFLFGSQHDQLGGSGRLSILGLVVVASLASGFFLEPRSAGPTARRARSTAFALAILAIFGLLTEAFIDDVLLSRPSSGYSGPDESGNVLLAAAIASVAAAVLLFRTWAGLVVAALAICAYGAAGAAVAYFRITPGWTAELLFLAVAVLLVGAAEWGRSRRGPWAVELLGFAAVIVPVIAALILSNEPAGRGLESFAGFLAIAAFTASIVRGSGGYAVAGGAGLFIVTLEVGFRHFAESVGFPVVLIASGLVLLAVAAALVRLLPRLGRGRRGTGHLGGDGVDLR